MSNTTEKPARSLRSIAEKNNKGLKNEPSYCGKCGLPKCNGSCAPKKKQ